MVQHPRYPQFTGELPSDEENQLPMSQELEVTALDTVISDIKETLKRKREETISIYNLDGCVRSAETGLLGSFPPLFQAGKDPSLTLAQARALRRALHDFIDKDLTPKIDRHERFITEREKILVQFKVERKKKVIKDNADRTTIAEQQQEEKKID